MTAIRISNGTFFGQIRRVGREWHAEMRESVSGDLIRFAGIWKTRRDAEEEVRYLLEKPEYR